MSKPSESKKRSKDPNTLDEKPTKKRKTDPKKVQEEQSDSEKSSEEKSAEEKSAEEKSSSSTQTKQKRKKFPSKVITGITIKTETRELSATVSKRIEKANEEFKEALEIYLNKHSENPKRLLFTAALLLTDANHKM